jgi:hypothetical protein
MSNKDSMPRFAPLTGVLATLLIRSFKKGRNFKAFIRTGQLCNMKLQDSKPTV